MRIWRVRLAWFGSRAFWEYDGWKSCYGCGNRGGSEDSYTNSLKSGEGGVGKGDSACVVMVNGIEMDVGGVGAGSKKRSGDVVGRGIGKGYCCWLAKELSEL